MEFGQKWFSYWEFDPTRQTLGGAGRPDLHPHALSQGVVLPNSIAFLEKVSKWDIDISRTRMVEIQNSSDLIIGRRPESESEEY